MISHEPFTKETKIGDCERCREPIMWSPGKHISVWKLKYDLEDGSILERFWHLGCWQKEVDSRQSRA